LDIENMRTKDKKMTNDTYPVVRENDTCPHWEYIGGESLAPMRECWYCKYSDFRKDVNKHLTRSVCRCPLNRSSERRDLSCVKISFGFHPLG